MYSDLVPVNFVTGLEIDTNGLLNTVQAQSVWVINPWSIYSVYNYSINVRTVVQILSSYVRRTSTLVRTIEFPVQVLDNLAFGGPNRDILFVVVGPIYYNQFFLANTTTVYYKHNFITLYGNRTWCRWCYFQSPSH